MKKTITLIALTVMTLLSNLPNVGAQKRTDIRLRVTIESLGSEMIISDGKGDYVDGEQGVSATLASGGEGDFIMDPTNAGSPNPRALFFNFSQKIASGAIPNPWDAAGWVAIDTYLNFNSINTVAINPDPNAYELRTGGFGQLYASTRNKSYDNLKFLPDPSAANYTVINTPNVTSYIEVRHPDCNTWILTPQTVGYIDSGYGSGSGAVAGLINIPNTSKGGTIQSVGQYLMPFKLTLTRKTPIACP